MTSCKLYACLVNCAKPFIMFENQFNGRVSSGFRCHMGVRQGDNLSQLLFSLYCDLEEFSPNYSCNYVNLAQNNDNLTTYLKLMVILYAND